MKVTSCGNFTRACPFPGPVSAGKRPWRRGKGTPGLESVRSGAAVRRFDELPQPRFPGLQVLPKDK